MLTRKLVALMVPVLIGSLLHTPDMLAAAVGAGRFGMAVSPTRQATPGLYQTLQPTWTAYQQQFIQGDGRVIDFKMQSFTTSEGQSYAMQRAVWMNDRATFDRVWHWTKSNLRVRGDSLLAWKWGQYLPEREKTNPRNLQPMQWGVLDQTSATDADQDVALALLMAHQRWAEPAYQREALALLADIWNKLTLASPHGQRVLLPGDWYAPGKWPDEVTLNPSYFSPYLYRVFAQADASRPWMQLVNHGYQQLARLQKISPTGLFPDWVIWNQKTDTYQWLGLSDAKERRGDFGYDAFRLLWRLQMDGVLFGERRAGDLLKPSIGWLRKFWQQRGRLPGPVTPQGQERDVLDSEAIYGGLFPVFQAVDPVMGQALERNWVHGHRNEQQIWFPTVDYYAQNWYWFGIALANRQQCPPKNPATSALVRLTEFVQPCAPSGSTRIPF